LTFSHQLSVAAVEDLVPQPRVEYKWRIDGSAAVSSRRRLSKICKIPDRLTSANRDSLSGIEKRWDIAEFPRCWHVASGGARLQQSIKKNNDPEIIL
jgi:hypothetical protein